MKKICVFVTRVTLIAFIALLFLKGESQAQFRVESESADVFVLSPVGFSQLSGRHAVGTDPFFGDFEDWSVFAFSSGGFFFGSVPAGSVNIKGNGASVQVDPTPSCPGGIDVVWAATGDETTFRFRNKGPFGRFRDKSTFIPADDVTGSICGFVIDPTMGSIFGQIGSSRSRSRP